MNTRLTSDNRRVAHPAPSLNVIGGSARDTSRSKSRGQAMVELAFITLLLTGMIVGTLELGRAFSAWIQVGNMARAGAQYGSIAGTMGDPFLDDVDDAVLEEQDEIYGVAPDVVSQVYKDEYGYCAVAVTVSYDFSPLVTVDFLPSTLTMSRTSEMRLQFVAAELDVPDEENACT